MTSAIDRLKPVPIREVWRDEARDLTPWLSKNLDALSEALGIDLELQGTEVSVGPFSADLLLRNANTGDPVVVENMMSNSDHDHLGKLITYAAGLEATHAILVAESFRPEHRSALQWLNANSTDAVHFFGVELKAWRIGESLPAPQLDVVVEPDEWIRAIRAETATELTRLRQRFWDRYLQKYPGTFDPTRDSNVWVPMRPDGSVILSLYVARKTSGMFIRGPRGTDRVALADFLARHEHALENALGPSNPSRDGYYYPTHVEIPLSAQGRWHELIDWMETQRKKYAETFQQCGANE